MHNGKRQKRKFIQKQKAKIYIPRTSYLAENAREKRKFLIYLKLF